MVSTSDSSAARSRKSARWPRTRASIKKYAVIAGIVSAFCGITTSVANSVVSYFKNQAIAVLEKEARTSPQIWYVWIQPDKADLSQNNRGWLRSGRFSAIFDNPRVIANDVWTTVQEQHAAAEGQWVFLAIQNISKYPMRNLVVVMTDVPTEPPLMREKIIAGDFKGGREERVDVGHLYPGESILVPITLVSAAANGMPAATDGRAVGKFLHPLRIEFKLDDQVRKEDVRRQFEFPFLFVTGGYIRG
jgi:hypothetical protein